MAIEQVATNVFGITIPMEADGAKAEFLLDNRDGRVRAGLLPFLGGVPDSSQIIFEVNLGGGVLGSRQALSTGFKWSVTGANLDGWQPSTLEVWAQDLQENKYNVPEFMGEGWLLAYRFEKNDGPAPVGGEIRFPKIILDGDVSSYDFLHQVITQQMLDDGSEPVGPWVHNSYAVYHSTKKWNAKLAGGGMRDVYRTGKALHIPPPRIDLFDGWTRKGGVWGWYEKTSLGDGTFLLTKIFDEAEVQAKVNEIGGANFTHFAVDATLGETDQGAIASARNNEEIMGSIGEVPENGIVSEHAYWCALARTTNTFTAVYNDTAGGYPKQVFPAGSYIADSQTTQAIPTLGLNQRTPITTTHNIITGQKLWFYISTYNDNVDSVRVYYDTDTVNSLAEWAGVTQTTAPSAAPASVEPQYNSTNKMSSYITYTPDTPPTPGTGSRNPIIGGGVGGVGMIG